MKTGRQILIAVVVGLIMAGAAGPGEGTQFERAVLDNDLAVIVGQNVATNVAGVFVGFRIGADTETEGRYPARALLQEHNRAYARRLLDSDPHFSPLAAELDNGGVMDFNTEWDYIQVRAACTPANLGMLLELVDRVLVADPLSPELIDLARLRLTQHYVISQENVGEQAYYLFRRAMLGNGAASRPVFGNPQSIGALSVEELTAFRQRYFTACNAAVVIISPQPADEVGRVVGQALGSWRRGLPPAPLPAPSAALREANVRVGNSPDARLATVVVGVALPPPGTPGFGVGRTLQEMLAGRQGRLRRDRTLLYSLALNLPFRLLAQQFPLRSIPITVESNAHLAVYAMAAPTAMESYRQAILRHFTSFREGAISPEELARAKKRVLNGMALAMQQPLDSATHLGQYEMLGVEVGDIQQAAAQVKALTVEQITKTANTWFHEHYIGVVLPNQNPAGSRRELSLPGA